MIWSLVTFAITLAAAIDKESPSPFTKDSCSTGNPFTGSPSTNAIPGSSERLERANAMARWVARRIFSSSISFGPTIATDQITPESAVITAYSSLRRFFESFLESSNKGHVKSFGRITAAAATGPARGPLPASSTPATRANPRAAKFSSYLRSGT